MRIRVCFTKFFQVLPSSSKVKTMAAAEPDYYELLGVSKGATLQEIRAEFRILETRWCKRRLYGKSGNSRRSLQNTSEYWMRVFDVFDSLFALRLHFQKAKSLHAASLESWFVNVCDRVQWCAMMCNDVQWCAMMCNDVQWCAMMCNGTFLRDYKYAMLRWR